MPFRMQVEALVKVFDQGACFQMVMRSECVAPLAQWPYVPCRSGFWLPTGSALFVHAK